MQRDDQPDATRRTKVQLGNRGMMNDELSKGTTQPDGEKPVLYDEVGSVDVGWIRFVVMREIIDVSARQK